MSFVNLKLHIKMMFPYKIVSINTILLAFTIQFSSAELSHSEIPNSVTAWTNQHSSITLKLSSEQISYGSVGELILTVTGADNIKVPELIPIDGLKIFLSGQNKSIQVVNFKITPCVVYKYCVRPLRTGEFNITPFSVEADGIKMRTLPLSVLVL